MKEIWKDIDGYEGLYQVSNLGRVKSLPRNGTVKTEKIMRLTRTPKGYLNVCLTKSKHQNPQRVHRLVAKAFIPNPYALPQVNHKDEDKTNNKVSNLEWCDNRYNCTYNGREKKVATKLCRKVRCIETGIVYDSILQASADTGIVKSNIIHVCQGKYKQIKGFHFKYED